MKDNIIRLVRQVAGRNKVRANTYLYCINGRYFFDYTEPYDLNNSTKTKITKEGNGALLIKGKEYYCNYRIHYINREGYRYETSVVIAQDKLELMELLGKIE